MSEASPAGDLLSSDPDIKPHLLGRRRAACTQNVDLAAVVGTVAATRCAWWIISRSARYRQSGDLSGEGLPLDWSTGSSRPCMPPGVRGCRADTARPTATLPDPVPPDRRVWSRSHRGAAGVVEGREASTRQFGLSIRCASAFLAVCGSLLHSPKTKGLT